MDAIDAINARRACRAWNETNVTEDMLNTILTCGRFAPSPLNVQPWKFTVVKDRAMISKLSEHAHHAEFLSTARVIIVVTVTASPDVDLWLVEHQQHIFSGACAIENMWIAATSLGLGGCWVTINNETIKELLGVPSDQLIVGSLALGHTHDDPKAHKSSDRLPLRDIVYYEKFGERK